MDDLTKRRARLRRYTTSKISDADELVAFVEQMIRLALAGATPLALVLEVAARQINDACVHAWGIEVRMKYLGSSSVLAPYIAADKSATGQGQVAQVDPRNIGRHRQQRNRHCHTLERAAEGKDLGQRAGQARPS